MWCVYIYTSVCVYIYIYIHIYTHRHTHTHTPFKMYMLDLEKAEEPEIKLPIFTGSESKEFQKNIYFCFIDYAKALDYVDHHKLWEILKEMGIPDHLFCFPRNLYAGQEASVRTAGHETTDWFQIGKGVRQGCTLPLSYLTYMQSISCKMPG